MEDGGGGRVEVSMRHEASEERRGASGEWKVESSLNLSERHIIFS
jgi:hypothetical protein